MAASGGGSGGSGSRGSRPSDIPETIGGRYKVTRLLGRGGQGIVCLAYDPNLAIEVAVKVLHPEYKEDEFVNRFKTEARTAVRLTAPNIVRVYDFNAEVPYLVMEYCGEGDLNERIKQRRPMILAESLGIIRQICQALVAAHDNTPQILHRDLKPGNVLFHHGVPKVADFGLAKMVGSGTGQTTTRGVMGTVRYCSPEQLRDASRVDHRADLWSVGIIMYELLTWTRPFDKVDDSFVNIALRVHTEPPKPPPYSVPAPVWKVIERTLQKNPDDRYQSAREMIVGIDEALRMMPDAATLRLPPESAVDDSARIAAELATLVEQGNSSAAESRMKELRKLAPEDSLSRYWYLRLKEVKEGIAQASSDSSVETVDRERVAWLEKQFASVQSLIKGRSYREARRLIGEILVNDPDNTVAQRWLEGVTDEERRFKEDLESAHKAADVARARSDFDGVCAVWSGLLSRWDELPEAQAELAVATRERDMRAQKGAREEAKRLVAERRGRGEFRAALESWRSYMQAFPQDREASRMEVELTDLLRQSERAARLAEATAEAGRLEKGGDLAGALALWKRHLAEDPDLSEAPPAVARLEAVIAGKETARRRDAAAAEAEARVVAGDFRGAAVVWDAWISRHAGDAQAVAERDTLARRAGEQEKSAAARELEKLLTVADGASSGGRYASSGSAGAKLAEAIRAARASMKADLKEMDRARRNLLAARGAAEEALRGALTQSREQLATRTAEARGSLSAEGKGSGQGLSQGLPQEDALKTALARAIAALTQAGIAAGPTDPVAALLEAEKAIGAAQEGLDRERRDTIASARKTADAALTGARSALTALEAQAAGDAAAQEEVGRLRGAIQAVGEQAAAKSPERILLAAGHASALRSEIEAATCRARFARARSLSALVAQATMLLPAAKGDKLAALIGKAREALEPGAGSSAIKPDAAAKAQEALAAEFAIQSEAIDKRLATARQRWKKALEGWTSVLRGNLGSPLNDRGDQVRFRGESALAIGRADQLETWASQLESLTRRYRVEAAWIEKSDGVLEAEGALDADGLPAAGTDAETRGLLERYRQAVAKGETQEMATLGAAIEKRRSKTPDRPDGAQEALAHTIPSEIAAGVRKFNERYNAAALKEYDAVNGRYTKASSQGRRGEAVQLSAEMARAHGRLIRPEPAWRKAIPAVAAIVVVLIAVWLALPQRAMASTLSVQVMSPGGATSVRKLMRDGNPVTGVEFTIPAEGAVWPGLTAGQYEITMENGARATFTMPGPTEVLLPTDASNYTRMLKEVLELDRLAEQP